MRGMGENRRVTLFPNSPAPPSTPEYVFLSSDSDGVLTVLDSLTGAVVATHSIAPGDDGYFLSTNPNGDVLYESYAGIIKMLDINGNVKWSITPENILTTPARFMPDGNVIYGAYIYSPFSSYLQIVSGDDGSLIKTIDLDFPSNNPYYLQVDDQGAIYVASSYADVAKYSSIYEKIYSQAIADVNNTDGIAVFGTMTVNVNNSLNSDINYLANIDDSGDVTYIDLGSNSNIHGAAFDKNGKLYVYDQSAGKMLVYDGDTVGREITSDYLSAFFRLDKDGNIYCGDDNVLNKVDGAAGDLLWSYALDPDWKYVQDFAIIPGPLATYPNDWGVS